MEKWMRRAGELLTGLALTNKENPAVVPYKPQKTEISEVEKRYFRRDKPERLGVSSVRIYRMLSELEGERRANIHSIMVVKDGVVISECSAPGYSVNMRQLSHSMTKTVIGMAIGFLVDEGKLTVDKKLVDIFPEYKHEDKLFSEITVKHLLTMRTGVKISEAGSVTESEWTKAFFASRLSFAPGAQFKYNSMNSYVLAKIVEKLSGMGIMEFLTPRLFSPLGIENVFWELGPEGLEKGGWGLYLSPESWAKLGVLMLNRGTFETRRILSEKWVKESISTHSIAGEVLGDFNYGYQLWVAREGDEFLFNGMLGQNTWVSPKNNIVVVLTAGNNELFQQSPALSIIRKYLGLNILSKPYDKGGVSLLREKEARFFETRRAVMPLARRRGLKYLLGLGNPMPYDSRFDELLGAYVFAKNNQGILPSFVRVMQNNYMGGMEELRVERLNDNIELTSREGGKDYRFVAGLYDFVTSTLDFEGEKYLVSALAEATLDENGRSLYKIELLFPELPNTRILNLSPTPDGKLTVKMLEVPNQRLAMPFLESFTDGNKKLTFAVEFIEKKLGEDFLANQIADFFEPTLNAVNKASKSFEKQLLEENLAVEEKMRPAKMLSALVSRFIKSDDDDDNAETPRSSFISDFLAFFKYRRKNEGEDG